MQVDIHINAEADLERLWGHDLQAAAAIAVTLEALQSDPGLSADLVHHGDGYIGQQLVNVKRWQKAKEARASIWRFRMLNTPATSYRVVYGENPATRQLCVLAVVHKDEFDYEIDSDLGRRILADWKAL